MKLYYPFSKQRNFYKTQNYGLSNNDYYVDKGRAGHSGIDMASDHGSTIYAACDGLVYSHINKDNPDLMQYRAVYQLVEENGVAYEVSYGHLGDIFVEPNTFIKKGTPIGTQSNTGTVFSGGKLVTLAMKKANSSAGSHLHFQVRLCKEVEKTKTRGGDYLRTGLSYLQNEKGYFYEVVNYENGYSGAIDPAQFWTGEYAVQKETVLKKLLVTLRYGSRGDQVKILQEKIGGLTIDGIFGKKTDEAVREYQKKNKLTVDGIVGPKTRSKLNT